VDGSVQEREQASLGARREPVAVALVGGEGALPRRDRVVEAPERLKGLLSLTGSYAIGWVVCAIPALLVGMRLLRRGNRVSRVAAS
jgi:hypothetical protein